MFWPENIAHPQSPALPVFALKGMLALDKDRDNARQSTPLMMSLKNINPIIVGRLDWGAKGP